MGIQPPGAQPPKNSPPVKYPYIASVLMETTICSYQTKKRTKQIYELSSPHLCFRFLLAQAMYAPTTRRRPQTAVRLQAGPHRLVRRARRR